MSTSKIIAICTLVYIFGVFIMSQIVGGKLTSDTDYVAVTLALGIPLVIAICVGVLL